MKPTCVVTPIKLDLEPQDLAYILNSSGKYDYLCFLDSSLYPNKYSKFSYIGWKPEFVIKNFNKKNEFINFGTADSDTVKVPDSTKYPGSVNIKYFDEHPLIFLKRNFNQYIG
jgi:hypothetical protein